MKKILMAAGLLGIGLLCAREVVVRVKGESSSIQASAGNVLYVVFQEPHGVDARVVLNDKDSTGLKSSNSPLAVAGELTALPPKVTGYVGSSAASSAESDLPDLEVESVKLQYAPALGSDLPDLDIESVDVTGSSKREKIFVFDVTQYAKNGKSYTLKFDTKKISNGALLSSTLLTVNVVPTTVNVVAI